MKRRKFRWTVGWTVALMLFAASAEATSVEVGLTCSYSHTEVWMNRACVNSYCTGETEIRVYRCSDASGRNFFRFVQGRCCPGL